MAAVGTIKIPLMAQLPGCDYAEVGVIELAIGATVGADGLLTLYVDTDGQ